MGFAIFLNLSVFPVKCCAGYDVSAGLVLPAKIVRLAAAVPIGASQAPDRETKLVQVALQIAQSVPARVFLRWLAGTASFIEVLTAPRAQTLTVDSANRFDGDGQQNLFA